MKKGLLVVVSGPAGSGKGTVDAHLLKRDDFVYSVSATTRAPRPGEVDGVHYHFISVEEFKERLERGDMIEYTQYCGNFYGSKVWHSTSQYRKTIWQCNRKFKNDNRCSTPHFSEEQLKTAFTEMFNSTIENRDIIIASVEEAIDAISDTGKFDDKISLLQTKLEAATEHIRSWVSKNAHCAMNQVEYETEYQNRNAEYKKIADEISEIEKKKTLLLNKQKKPLK